MSGNHKSKKRPDILECLCLEMLALGLKRKQVDRIVADSLSGRVWNDLSEAEQAQIASSLQKRIIFFRKLLITLSCPTCQC